MEEVQVDFIKEGKGKTDVVFLKGNLTGLNCDRVKDKLLVLDVSLVKKLKVDMSEVESLDLALLQVLYAFLKKLEINKTEYEIAWPKNEELTGLIGRSGLILK